MCPPTTGAEAPVRMMHLRSRSVPTTLRLHVGEHVPPPYSSSDSTPTTPGEVSELQNWRARMVLLGAFLANVIAFGWVTSSGYFFDYYSTHQYKETSAFAISWLSSLGFFFLYAVSLPLSKLCSDSTFGPRPIIFSGIAIDIVALVLLPLTYQLYQLLILQAFLNPLGVSMVFNASITILSKWFRRKATLAITIASAGGGVGGLCFPFLISKCLDSIGYDKTIIACTVIHLILLIITCLTMTMPPGCQHERARARILKPLLEIQFTTTAMGAALFNCGYYTILTFLVAIARERGMSNPSAALAVANGCNVPGRLFAGWVAKSRGLYNTLLIFTAIAWALTLGVFAHATSVIATFVYAATWGFFTGASISLLPAIVFQRSPPPEISVRIGMLYFIMSFGVLAGPPISASILGHVNSYLPIIYGMGGCQAFGWLLWLAARYIETGPPSVTIV